MPGRLLACVLASAALAACSPGGASSPPAPASPPPSPAPPVALQPPAAAILPAAAELPLVGARDHLSAAEYAAGQPDQVVALDQVTGWAWTEASRRTRSVTWRPLPAHVLRTDRVEGAQAALAAWAADAAQTPSSAGPCPAAVTGLDDCRVGTAGDRSIWVGRLDAEVFRIDAQGLDAAPLAAEQARRLRAS